MISQSQEAYHKLGYDIKKAKNDVDKYFTNYFEPIYKEMQGGMEKLNEMQKTMKTELQEMATLCVEPQDFSGTMMQSDHSSSFISHKRLESTEVSQHTLVRIFQSI